MQGFLSCAVCASIGDHSTENCPRKAQRNFNADGEAIMRDHRGEYNEMDLLFTHPESGSKIYVGNITASKNPEKLRSLQVSHIVNCMARNTDASLAERFSYFRFPVETWEGEMVRRGGDPGGVSDGEFRASIYFAKLFEWVDDAIATPGQGVLIHCFAGAHRGGAVSVAYLMHVRHLRLPEALDAVKAVRPIVDPQDLLMPFSLTITTLP